MIDPIFGHPRLAEIYDVFDDDRRDLDLYLAIADEVHAASVLDIGCGTGTLACLFAQTGRRVVGLDPAEASVAVARRKPGWSEVQWIVGDVGMLPPVSVDLVTMTGNVAQVFVTDDRWNTVLAAARSALRAGGTLAFETRNPDRAAWLEWTREESFSSVDVPAVGNVQSWVDVSEIALPHVTFRWTFVFASDGVVLTSDSTLRFRSEPEVRDSLSAAGFDVREVRDAADRPGRELVFIATR